MGEPIATVGKLAGICGYDGSDWLKGGIPFAYYDRWAFLASTESTGDADTLVSTATVDEGYIYVCTGLGCFHDDAAARIVNVALDVADTQYYFCGLGLVVQNQWEARVVNAILKKDDKLTAHITSLTSGKTMYFRGVGYKMKIDM